MDAQKQVDLILLDLLFNSTINAHINGFNNSYNI